MKVGIIGCQNTEDMCPGNINIKVVSKGNLAFEKLVL
jgi:hypothetical protein